MYARLSALPGLLVLVLTPLAFYSTPLPAQRPIARQIPLGPMIERAYSAGTRDSSGSPGRNYWQQTVDYSIVKAPLALHALGGVVGDSAVRSAFAGYARAWRYKHPSPWDFFMFMDRALGRDLGWFWNSWWFTTQTFDQGIANVKQTNGTLTLTVADHGNMPMPVIARVDFTDGSSQTITRPASVWFPGTRSTTLTLPLRGKSIAHVTLDPEKRFQDLDRSNNEWNARQ